ncbi:MAG: hypothetical protein RI601_12465, partial [Desulfurivibrionaceae bacterium]|nr:hypothetical protein [Desulfurivibrionaceae bacterium]
VCYDDGWSALNDFRDLLAFMASVDSDDISADDFSRALTVLGFEDMTDCGDDKCKSKKKK